MITTCDTSVLIPALASWHPEHKRARRAVEGRVEALPAHVLLESYSVLTRLPSPHRIAPEVAAAAVGGVGLKVLTLPASGYPQIVQDLAAAGVRGGSVYDALVGVTARHHDCLLLTLDRRARSTYDLLGISFEAM